MTAHDARLLDAMLRNDFLTFAQRVFRELNPGRTFEPGWHHEAIADRIGVVVTGQYNRVIINLPPRSAKSTIVSVALPAFLLGQDPSKRLIVVCYNQELANFFGRQTRQVMQSDWYRRLFPSTVIPTKAAEGKFYTTAGGYRLALSTGGTFTGRGGDLIIIDDPLKGDDANSEVARNALLEWTNTTLFSRLDDKRTGGIILVQQRQHEDDLAGHMLRTGEWLSLSLPAIAVKDEDIVIGRNPTRFHHRREGDLLDPVREPRSVLDGLRRQMGTSAFSAQYQQDPLPPDGDIIKTSWFKTYRDLPESEQQILSVDTASKAGLLNDWSVAMLWRVVGKRFFLESVWRRRVEFPDLVHAITDLARTAQPDTILIEDKGTGIGLIQTLRDAPEGFPVVAYDPGTMDKESRMRVQSYKIEGGLVLLPPSAPWLQDFLDEVRRFPNGTHDDQIDAMSQALDYASRRGASLWIRN
jgi:predicted phage terminase large subunit-like protein